MSNRPIFQIEERTDEGDWLVRISLVHKNDQKYELQYLLLLKEGEKEAVPKADSEIIVDKSMPRDEQIGLVISILKPIIEKKIFRGARGIAMFPKIESQIVEKWPK